MMLAHAKKEPASVRPRTRLSPLFVLLLCLAVCILQAAVASSVVVVGAAAASPSDGEDDTTTETKTTEEGGDGSTTTNEKDSDKKAEEEEEEEDPDAKHERLKKEREAATARKKKLLDENADWGTFYDPQNIFCGKYDCYKILGFDHFTFYKKRPSKKEITSSYRALSRAWHPDKNKRKGAKERFVKIARAYEVLTKDETREEYDFYRDRPDEYFQKYGSSVLWTYAPKSDWRFIVVLLLAFFSWLSLFVKKQRWQHVANHLTKAAMDGLGMKEGGSTESIEIRKKALEILEERQQSAKASTPTANGNSGGSAASSSPEKKGGKKGSKQTAKEKKEAQKEELRLIVAELVNEIDDFGGGFSKPTWRDLFVVQLVMLPWYVGKSAVWWTMFAGRRVRKLEYNDDELTFFTRRAVGEAAWDCATDEEKETMKTRELWVQSNLEDWREELETQNLSPGDQKRYRRWKKKEGTKME